MRGNKVWPEYRKILCTLKPWFHRLLSPLRNVHRGTMGRNAMYLKKTTGPRTATLPDGSIISLADLPDPGTTRWVASRKAKVVKAVLYGLISQDDALHRYELSEDEFREWVVAISIHGEDALKATRVKVYRQP